jgi:hypothetical protein
MSGRKTKKEKKTPTSVVAVPEGLQIENDEQFYKDIRTALKVALGASYLSQTTKQIGLRQLVYIREPSSPTVLGREGPLPALALFIDERQSAWLVIELESEYGGKPLMLKHVSLKLWQGMTTEAAHLCFRAEWDVRNSHSSHAQPHWNVHAPQGAVAAQAEDIDFNAFIGRQQGSEINSFSDFVQAEEAKSTDVAPPFTSGHGLSVEQMHKFHFAMAANWHVSNGRAGPLISTTDEVVIWISSCARYIKSQFAFVMGS